jgi:hypothetical protein
MRSLMRSNQIFGDLKKVWIVTNLAKSLKKLVSIPITVEKSSERRDRGPLGILIKIYLNSILKSAFWIDMISEQLSCTKQSNRRVSLF